MLGRAVIAFLFQDPFYPEQIFHFNKSKAPRNNHIFLPCLRDSVKHSRSIFNLFCISQILFFLTQTLQTYIGQSINPFFQSAFFQCPCALYFFPFVSKCQSCFLSFFFICQSHIQKVTHSVLTQRQIFFFFFYR